MYEAIVDALCMELRNLDDRFADGAKINTQELENIDKMAHALKCLKTYEAMEESGYRSRRRYDDRRY